MERIKYATKPASIRHCGLIWMGLLCLWGCDRILGLAPDPRLDDSPWHCLASDGTRVVDPPEPTNATIRMRFEICDFPTECTAEVSDVEIKVCGQRDGDCSQPIDTPLERVGSEFQFDVATGVSGFAGYIDLTSKEFPCFDEQQFGASAPRLCELLPNCDPKTSTGDCNFPRYFRTRYYFNPPVVEDMEFPERVYVVPSNTSVSDLEAAGIDYDVNTGVVTVIAKDCNGFPVADVELSIDDTNAVPLLNRFGALVPASDDANRTDLSGVELFSNVSPGARLVTAHDPSGAMYGSVGVFVLPFSITMIGLWPNR